MNAPNKLECFVTGKPVQPSVMSLAYWAYLLVNKKIVVNKIWGHIHNI